MERQNAKGQRRGFRYPEPPPELDRVAHDVIGAAIEVHRTLGPGFLEAIYEHAMSLELRSRSIPFRPQLTLPISYKGSLIGESRIDLLVADTLVVELKAVEELRPVHKAQVLPYLRAGEFQLGLLINFNVHLLPHGLQRVVWTG